MAPALAMRGLAWLLLAAVCAAAQGNPAPPAAEECRPDRPVDDYIAELAKLKPKRNSNPLPDNVCILGWCRSGNKSGGERKRGTVAPPPELKTRQDADAASSSSKQPDYDPLAAAHTVEVGDFYFQNKNYRAALNRYREGLELKPGDAAIYLRIGRAAEKLKLAEAAFEHYDAALALAPGTPAAAEAQSALERLRAEVEQGGFDVEAIRRRNRELKPACVVLPPSP